MHLRPDEQCWWRDLDDEDTEKRCIGVFMLSGPNASSMALMEVADLMLDDDATIRNLVFARLLQHPRIPKDLDAVAYRFLRRVGYGDKRNYICAMSLLLKANPTKWIELVSVQVALILQHERDAVVRTMAHEALINLRARTVGGIAG